MSTYLDPDELALLITDEDLTKYTEVNYEDQWHREVDDSETYLNILLLKKRLSQPIDWASVTSSVRQLIVAYLHMTMSLHRIGNNPQQSDTGLVYDLYKSKYVLYKDVFGMLESQLTEEMITGVISDDPTASYVIATVRG